MDITVQEDVGTVMIPVVLEDPVATPVTVDIEYVFDTAGSNGKTLHYSMAYSICMLCIELVPQGCIHRGSQSHCHPNSIAID